MFRFCPYVSLKLNVFFFLKFLWTKHQPGAPTANKIQCWVRTLRCWLYEKNQPYHPPLLRSQEEDWLIWIGILNQKLVIYIFSIHPPLQPMNFVTSHNTLRCIISDWKIDWCENCDPRGPKSIWILNSESHGEYLTMDTFSSLRDLSWSDHLLLQIIKFKKNS